VCAHETFILVVHPGGSPETPTEELVSTGENSVHDIDELALMQLLQ
jgi:hypothetical protein